MKNKKLITSLLVPLLLLVWIWMFRVPPSSQPTSSIQAPVTNFLAPEFELETISGEEINLSELQGQPVIINFWASWCPPCRAEMPAFQAAWQEYEDDHLVIIAINATHQDSRADVEEFIKINQLTFPILLDSNGAVSATYQIHSLPTTYFINREGIITNKLIGGPIPLSLLRIEVDQLLQDNQNATNH
jgi:peroxiredoxin